MRHGGFRLGLAMLLMGSLGSGCQLPKPRKPYPPDPIFESKQPLQQPTKMAATPSPVTAAVAAPRPPQFPNSFLVAPFNSPPGTGEGHSRDRFAADRDSVPPPGIHPLGSAPPTHPTAATQETGAEESATPPAVCGHADDFRWLIGVIEKQIDGRLMLRFADAGAPFAGKVCLLPNTILARFADGDLIRVEGLLGPRLTAPPADRWDDPPVYWVVGVSRVQ